MCIAKIKAAWRLLKDGEAMIKEVKQALDDLTPIIAGLQPLLHDLGPLVNDIPPLVKDMHPVVLDIQKIIHDVQPVVHDTHQQFMGPDLRGWEDLGQDAQGAFLTLKDAIAQVKVFIGNPEARPPGTPPPPPGYPNTLAGAIFEVANVLAPLAGFLPHPFGLPEPPPSEKPKGRK